MIYTPNRDFSAVTVRRIVKQLVAICVILAALSPSLSFAKFDDPRTQEDIRRCLDKGNAEGQITFCTKLINTFGTADRAAASGWYWNRAHGYMSKNRHSESMADFNESIRLRPDIYLWYVGRGRLYDKLSQFEQAMADFNESIRLNPRQPDAYYFRGLVREHQGDVKGAINDYLESVRRDRSYRPPLERLAALMQNQKGADSSTSRAAPSEAAGLNQKAQELAGQGRYAEAEPLLKKALSIAEGSLGAEHPEITNILSNLGEVYRREGKYDAARSYFDRALALSEKVSGPKNLRTAAALVDLSLLDIEQNRFEDAKPLAERAFAICRSQPSKQALLGYLLLFSDKYAGKNECNNALPLLKEAAHVYQANAEAFRSDAIQKLERLSQKCGAPPLQKPSRQEAESTMTKGEGRPLKGAAFACPGGKTARIRGSSSHESSSICIQ